ncbi:5-hydroxytryptamine receptor 7 isoform X1 [Neodiprion pinetum]|uniref:5-hydroxytryptamine receptor 1 isoform X1 n=1 Tax=Neodiprion lecontei TaxID=441921 RepID=A0ABM3GL37_NEOLC|nr:5-hydroxytryptamine receptor 1-like isoform X1 [Neodiprion fabricii]XP_046434976.1 5-hydroxytryptamine receptor 1-like isoform X1 [Neodiprion fabricii]XP_046434977.1 5-hydroxytryptamine receptor 1-like isoform X1 [Neodiprion fabricii]XP_046490417.1 5-hydroxytryptamine receptor 1-like isoform X1 [Neodiprion pinetum]XP_046490419.1 5-hydroxytryptamine receptor 1-like isoform X1 [Neodiprion pinetum]XP_046490420.1 5-hydroxytryptamine receptor 1-like isoform X1 [Neodiprion pinetum]XP_046600982.1
MAGTSETYNVTWHPHLSASTPANEVHEQFFRDFPGKDSPYTTLQRVIMFQAIVLALVLGSIIIGTVIGNILVCVAVFLVKKLRRPCNYLLVSLAVSDICVALLVMPMALLYEILGSWPFNSTICDLWVSFDVLSCAASILNLCVISVDRYNAITKPLEYGVKRTPKRMVLWVSFVWLGAACISLPPLLIMGNEHTHSKTGAKQCAVCQNFFYQIYATLASFYIPLIVMIVVYYKIFCAARKIVLEERRAQNHLEAHCYLDIEPASQPTAIANRQLISDVHASQGSPPCKQHRSSSGSTTCSSNAVRCFAGGPRRSNESQCPMLQKVDKHTSSGAASIPMATKSTIIRNHLNSTCSVTNSPHRKKLRFQLAKERKASTTLGIIMSAFIVCWLPFFVLALVRPFLNESNAIPAALSSLFLWLGYCNSLLNPIIYATLNRDFRKPFREILYFRCGNLNHMMREEFYQSQYGDPVNNHVTRACDLESGGRLESHGVEALDVASNPANESFL